MLTDFTAFTPDHRATNIHLSISLWSLPLRLLEAHIMAPLNYTALSGTHLHLDGVKQCMVNFFLKEISSALKEVSKPGPFDPEARVLPRA